jgi:hypothetical protein
MKMKDAGLQHLGVKARNMAADGPILDILRMLQPGTWFVVGDVADQGPAGQGWDGHDSQWLGPSQEHSKRSTTPFVGGALVASGCDAVSLTSDGTLSGVFAVASCCQRQAKVQ